MAFRKLLQITLLLNSCVSVLEAQELFPDSLTPGFRGDTGTEYSEWDIFFDPYLGPNFGDVAAATSAPTITQDLNPSAFITSSFNIYDFAGQVGFTLQNDVSATIGASAGPVNTIVLQLQSQGNFFDYDTIQLNYGPSYSNSVSPVNLISESRVILGGFGGFVNKVALQWDLTGLGIEDYTITFRSASSSTSLDIAELDVSTGAFSEIVPGTRTWDGGAGNTQWSSAANWSGDDLGLDSATVVFNNTAPVAVDLNVHREVGQLNLDRDGTFTLSSSNGSTLTLNTGISLAGATGTAAEITADIFMGGHNFIDVDAGNTLTLNTVVSGDGAIGLLPATGIFKSGTGALVLSQNNTFTGGVEVNEGTLIVEGANAYTGPTVIFRGQFVARTDAPDGSAGALGNATSNITVGSGSFFGSTGNLGIEDAELIIDGAFEVGRNIDFTGGTDGKRLAGRNTGFGATFSGALALGASADNVKLDAEGASDSVSFTGSITGGSSAAGQSVIINSGSSQGAVVFAGSNKTYQNDTVINAGTLVIDSGTAYTGAGNWEVITGASLVVDGELSGSGSLVLNGGTLQGSGLVSKALTVDTGDVLSPGNSPG
ncbi:MAG: autotransporter-associated beta strand repeat-containing protein, partial [Verrucomicrobiota bacterium]